MNVLAENKIAHRQTELFTKQFINLFRLIFFQNSYKLVSVFWLAIVFKIFGIPFLE